MGSRYVPKGRFTGGQPVYFDLEYTLRRNAVVMPLYTLTLALIFFAGFLALCLNFLITVFASLRNLAPGCVAIEE